MCTCECSVLKCAIIQVHVYMCKCVTESECMCEYVCAQVSTNTSVPVCISVVSVHRFTLPQQDCGRRPLFSPAASSNGPATSPATGPGPAALGRCPAGAPPPASIPGSNLPGSGAHSDEASSDAAATPPAACSSPSAGTSGLTVEAGTCGPPALLGFLGPPGPVCVGLRGGLCAPHTPGLLVLSSAGLLSPVLWPFSPP